MKRNRRRILSTTLALALATVMPSSLNAEDVDLFMGAASPTTGTRPNVLIVIDSSANWSAASQHWADNVKQGQSELRALRTLAGEVGDTLNMGLMLFTPGSGSNEDGAYVRYHLRQMTTGNKTALQELIGDGSCVDGPNSLNGTPNCIFKNFDSPTEKVGTSKTDYSAAVFEVFKYLGGFTNPANAQTGIAGSPVDSSHFGQDRYSGDPDPKSDPDAYVNGFATYKSPYDINNNCAKTYVIFIGNGFPTQDSPDTLLSGIQGDTTQLPMPQFTTTNEVQNSTIGTQCGTGNNSGQRQSNCEANIPQALKDANPADTYTCVNERVDAICPGANDRLFDVEASKSVLTVTPVGTTAVPPTNEARYADEWAKYLFTTDVSPEPGKQNATLYTIDVFKDAQDSRQTALLMSMAKYGGGRYFSATSEQAILDALREILIEIQAVNSVFASASLPINATNRSQNENQVFIGMFRPDPNANPRWYGNLKRYQVALFGDEAKLADRNGKEAVSAATGFVQSCASSFFTTDTGTYWNFSPISAGQCTIAATSPFSDEPDGSLVEKGAVAEVIRRGNNPAAAPTSVVNRTVYTCPLNSVTCSLVPFNTATVPDWRVQASSSTEHQRIINFTLGKDVNDENGNNDFDEPRPSLHGDVTHSRPLPVNFGGTTGVVVFYGSNEGTFRAVHANTGRELWAFIGSEHHRFLKRLYQNSPIVTYPGLPPFVTSERKNYFFDGSAGLYQNADNTKVWVFPTMRRGGRRIHAFDVTNPFTPVLKWRFGCGHLNDDVSCTSGSSGIGQTWSTPNVASTLGYSGGGKPFLVVGGGYDACEDADTSAPSCGSAKGRKVYILDADNGAILQSFDTQRSVPADVTLVDRNFDGHVDHGYVVDLGGNVYRIDFVNPATLGPLPAGSWAFTHIARTNDPATNPNAGRKFHFAPAALPATDRVYLAFGSGDRERPLEVNYPYMEDIQNRFYMFMDTFVAAAPVDLDGAALSDFTVTTTCPAVMGSGAIGWRMDLNNGRGEQTVTSAAIFGGLVFFSTNRPEATLPGQCGSNLGEARGYAVNLLNASGAVGTEELCGADRSGIFIGGGLPPSPVVGSVPINGKQITVVIGGIQRTGTASSPIAAQRVRPTITQRRNRLYWYTHGDQ